MVVPGKTVVHCAGIVSAPRARNLYGQATLDSRLVKRACHLAKLPRRAMHDVALMRREEVQRHMWYLVNSLLIPAKCQDHL